jgi:uncharacterized phage protein gp47/JayE
MTSTFNSAGVSMNTYADILARAIVLAKQQWSSSVDTSEDEYLGHIMRNIALELGDTNDVVQEVYDQSSILNATGTKLDNMIALLGMTRLPAAYSTVTLTIYADVPTTVPAGSRFSTAAGVIFATDEELVFAAAGNATVSATCTVTGPYEAAPGEVDTVVTSIYGVAADGVDNVAAATPGRNRETATEVKARHTIVTATSGEDDVSAIYLAVSQVAGVSALRVFENDTDSAIGVIPARSIHVVTIGGDADEIAAAISTNKTATVATYGSQSVSVYNSTTGQTKVIKYDIGSTVPIHINIEYTPVAGVFPSNGEDLMREYLIDFFDDYKIGDDVIYTSLYKPIYSVPGIIVDVFEIHTSDPPTGHTSDITIDIDELATLVTGNIDISET